jgi:hypothetical protein
VTDPEARRKVAERIYQEALGLADEMGLRHKRELMATAYAKLSGNIINLYLLCLLTDTDELKGKAS